MLRKNAVPGHKLNGYGAEKVAQRAPLDEVNGFAPEKLCQIGQKVHFCVHFYANGHQNEAILCLIGASKHPWNLNGYAPEYAASNVPGCGTNVNLPVTELGYTYERMLGDVDGDGYINIGDVTTLIRMLLGADTGYPVNADVNLDGIISIGDVTALINVLLRRS